MMDILDNIEEYTKLKSTFDTHFSSNIVKKDDMESKLSLASKSIEDVRTELKTYKTELESKLESYRLDTDSKLLKLTSDTESKILKLNGDNDSKLLKLNGDLESNKNLNIELLKQFNEYKQNTEEYKKITNDRIEKLVKLFLSINK
jgi:hypothetical protein